MSEVGLKNERKEKWVDVQQAHTICLHLLMKSMDDNQQWYKPQITAALKTKLEADSLTYYIESTVKNR